PAPRMRAKEKPGRSGRGAKSCANSCGERAKATVRWQTRSQGKTRTLKGEGCGTLEQNQEPAEAARLRTIKVGPSFLALARAGLGSKQRRQRASYIPPPPTTTSSSLSTKRWVCTAGLPQRTQIASSLVISSATARRRGMGSKGRPR